MPSNALKITHLIDQLQQTLAEHGDLDVVLAVPVDHAIVAIDGRNVNVVAELLGRKLPDPVLVFGMWRDQAGRLRNTPGSAYLASKDKAGEYNYNRAEAPEGTDLVVWKRYGGKDVGKRVGDRWFVREKAQEWPRRPVEIVPEGILGWRLP